MAPWRLTFIDFETETEVCKEPLLGFMLPPLVEVISWVSQSPLKIVGEESSDLGEGGVMANGSQAGLAGVVLTSTRISKIEGNTITFERPLKYAHKKGEIVSVEWIRERWYVDADFGTTFWHDHVYGLDGWGHGFYSTFIAEPPRSTYHDPVTGKELRSGPVADIHTTEPVSAHITGSFREIVTQVMDSNPRTAELITSDNPQARVGAISVDGTPSAGREGYRHYLETLRNTRPAAAADRAGIDAWAAGVLTAHGRFQLLCALRRGPWGVEGLNPRIAGWLREAGLIGADEGWYEGRPVLVTRNDYGLGLMNGDMGITLALPLADGGSQLRVAFPSGDGRNGIKWVLPSRLQAVETVFALTVHKSQGSEFTHAALALPDSLNPILTRELVYTGITRARSGFTLVDASGSRVLEQAVARRVLRLSGLLDGFA